MLEEPPRPIRKRLLLLFVVAFTLLLSVSFIFGYAVQLIGTWYSSEFINYVAIISSIILFFICLMLSFLSIAVQRNYIFYESVLEHPSVIEKPEFVKWYKIAKRIKQKKDDLFYILFLSLPPLYAGYFILQTIVWAIGGMVKISSVSTMISSLPLAQQILLFIGFYLVIPSIVIIPTMIILFAITSNFMTRYLRYPSDEDFVFAESFIISNFLANNDRTGAQKEMPAFTNALTRFSRNLNNLKRKSYNIEFSELRKNKTALSRMILFSPDVILPNLQELFLSFGLSFMNWNDSVCFNSVELLIRQLEGYKPVGRLQKLHREIESYPKEMYIVLISIVVIASFVGIPQLGALL
jgi:hypothetical protein